MFPSVPYTIMRMLSIGENARKIMGQKEQNRYGEAAVTRYVYVSAMM